jgi:hypothetical protein
MPIGHAACGHIRTRVARFFLVQNTKTGKNIPNDHKIYHMDITYLQWPQNRPNGHKIYQDFPLQGPPKFTQIGIFGSKTNHLATLIRTVITSYWLNSEK